MPFVPAHIDVQAPGSQPERTALVLHGILGSAKNWRGFMRKLVRDLPHRRFVLVDLRNHGDSNGARPPHTLAACADDLDHLCADLGVTPDTVIGHSFGGKVALTYAERHGDGLDQVWVLDASPAARSDDGDGEVERVIRHLREVPQPLERRDDVVDVLLGMGFSDLLAKWMTTNLEGTDDAGYTWRFDLDAVEAMLADYLATDLWPFVEAPGDRALHFVRGSRSDTIPDTDADRLADHAALHVLDAGHWLHVDDPGGLSELLAKHL